MTEGSLGIRRFSDCLRALQWKVSNGKRLPAYVFEDLEPILSGWPSLRKSVCWQRYLCVCVCVCVFVAIFSGATSPSDSVLQDGRK